MLGVLLYLDVIIQREIQLPRLIYTDRNIRQGIGGPPPSPRQIVLFVQDLRVSSHTHFRTSMYLMVVEDGIVWCLNRVENLSCKEIFYHYSSTWTLPLYTLLSLDWAVIPGHVTFSCPV